MGPTSTFQGVLEIMGTWGSITKFFQNSTPRECIIHPMPLAVDMNVPLGQEEVQRASQGMQQRMKTSGINVSLGVRRPGFYS